MELHPVEPPLLVGNGHVGTGVGPGGECEALRHLGHIVPVAHPGYALLGQPLEQPARGVVAGKGLAVLPGGVVLGGGDLPAQGVGQVLAAVADAQDGHAPAENFRIHPGGAVQIDGVRPAGENNPNGLHGPELRQWGAVGLDLAVHIALPHPAGDQLVVLAAEIQNQNSFHSSPPSLCHNSPKYQGNCHCPLIISNLPRFGNAENSLWPDRFGGILGPTKIQEDSLCSISSITPPPRWCSARARRSRPARWSRPRAAKKC